jgi:thioredoxin 1
MQDLMVRKEVYEEKGKIQTNDLETQLDNPHKVIDVHSYEELNDMVQHNLNDIVVVKFYSDKCLNCSIYAPMYEKFNKKYGHELTFTQANMEDDLRFVYKYTISNLPTILIIKDGNLYYKRAGTFDYSDMMQKFDNLINSKSISI